MLTRRQKQVLDYVDRHIKDEGGVSPSMADIMAGCGVTSKGHVSSILNGLEERGYIRRLPFRARAIEVIAVPVRRPIRGDLAVNAPRPPRTDKLVTEGCQAVPVMGYID